MGRLIGPMFETSPLLLLPLIALILFVIAFSGTIAQVIVRGAKAYTLLERMPLEDDGEAHSPRDVAADEEARHAR